MPDRADLATLRASAIADVDQYLRSLDGGASREEPPRKIAEKYSVAWRIPVEFSTAQYELLLLLDNSFPHSMPRVVVDSGPKLLEWPHLEDHGLLCLYPGDSSTDANRPVEVVEMVLAEACRLIEDNLHDRLIDDFREEFASYWNYAADDAAKNVVSLLELGPPDREVAVVKTKAKWFVGESEADIRAWLNRRFGNDEKYKAETALFVWQAKPWCPSEFPMKAADILQLLRSDKALKIPAIKKQMTKGLVIVVGSSTSSGSCVAVLSQSPPKTPKQGPKRSGSNPLTKGFRPGKVPDDIAVARSFGSGAHLTRHNVSRADHSWIHGRDQDSVQAKLKEKQVAVVGGGSLGSEVIRLLAMSGVGEIIVIDPQTLTWENLSRHSLGARSVGTNKATGLANEMTEHLPHSNVLGVPRSITTTDDQLLDKVFSSNLALSSTGIWGVTSLLGQAWLDRGRPTALITAWLEAHAMSAHSVHLNQDNLAACLNCGFDGTGRPRFEVTSWPSDPLLRTPMCGGVFMPYGPVELARSAALVADHCLDVLCREEDQGHRVWVAEKSRLVDLGGVWADSMLAELGDPGPGGFIAYRNWSKDLECCGS